jgi:hypothetical protein
LSDIDNYVRTVTNAQLAKALEYLGSTIKGGISDAIMMEAARRLRQQPEPHFVEPPKPDLPPLKAYAELDGR